MMSNEQMSLFDSSCYCALEKTKNYMILVRQMNLNGLNHNTVRAVVNDQKVPETVRNKIFKDKKGNQYVGCRFLERESKKYFSNCIQLTKTEQDLNVLLKFKVNPVKKLIAEKRRNYYANKSSRWTTKS
ncbi:hypothetical protein LNP18_06575 [Leuconostoc citreum]|uniref:hypothetical protein n=1 Tax=Leuconostoc citreum TaxID=33964 RepID=UPI00200A8708|nr:hypothetical protein [Leuconostoc citreum]MCK8605769.1 hypothetical protein [Leuconostoc citreum]